MCIRDRSKAEAIKTKATEAQFAENKAAGEKFLAEKMCIRDSSNTANV